MFKNIKHRLLILASLIAIATPALMPLGTASAAVGQTDFTNNLCAGSNVNIGGSGTACSDGTDTSEAKLNKLLTNAINIFSAIVGVIAVIMVIYGGLKYITSGGDANKVGSAKNTLLYALVGLVIVALAQIIVHFVIHQAADVASTGSWLLEKTITTVL